MARFKSGDLSVIVAPQVLDEGVDVPEADLAIIIATSQERRQMIQRMGRVLRKKKDRRRARFAILFVQGTSEDPEHGAHREFLGEILDVADEVKLFDRSSSPNEVAEFLKP